MNGLPQGWVLTPIGEICTLINGRAFKPSEWKPEGLPIIRIQNLNNRQASFNYFQGELGENHLVQPGELLFAWSGTPGTSFGAHVWDGPPAALNQHIFRVLFDNRVVDRDFFRYAINSKLQELIGRAQGGVGLAHVTKGKFEATLVPLPPLPEQRRIVTKIEAMMARSSKAREVIEKTPRLLERYRESALAAAFRGDLTKEWRSSHPLSDSAPTGLVERIQGEQIRRWHGTKPLGEGAKIHHEGMDPIPKQWRWAHLENLVDPNRGIPYGIVQTGEETACGIPTVRCGDIKDFDIDLNLLKRVDPNIECQYERTRLQGGEVLIAIRGTVGATAVACPQMAGMNISREVALIPVLPGINPDYLSLILATPPVQRMLMGHVKGVAQSGINLSDLRTLPVPIPCEEEQAEIVQALRAALGSINRLAQALSAIDSNIDSLDHSILAKAFRGKLVPQDPTDEPAEIFLSRIRCQKLAEKPALRRGRTRKGL